MAPFASPQSVVSGFKERVEAVTVQGALGGFAFKQITHACIYSGGKLYLGTAVGNLHVYNVNTGVSDKITVVLRLYSLCSRRKPF